MKKLFLSIMLLALPILASAQEVWSAASVIYNPNGTPYIVGADQSTLTEGVYGAGTAYGPDTNVQGALATETITGETESIRMSIVSTPNNLSNLDVENGVNKVFWSVKGGESSNESLTTGECNPIFEYCLMPKGNPTIVYWDYYDGNVFRVGNTDDIYWTEGKPLPVKGSYIKIEANASGSLTLGVYVNKGNHPLYIVDAANCSLLPVSDIKVKFYYQNTSFAYKQEKVTNEYGEEVVVSQTFINEGTMSEDHIIQHTNGETQNEVNPESWTQLKGSR